MHDWLNKDKRDALEYVIDEEEEKDKKDAQSGDAQNPEDEDSDGSH